jgi:hypothetical protein
VRPQVCIGEGDSLAAGRGRQRLKIAGLGYACGRHGIDATVELSQASVLHLCRMAIEYVAALPGSLLRGRRIDQPFQGDVEILQVAAIAYESCRHGIDADVGMAKEGLAMLCQAAVDYSATLPLEDQPRRSIDSLQLGNGARP